MTSWPYLLAAVVVIAALWMAKPLISLYFTPAVQLAAEEEPATTQRSVHEFTPKSISGEEYPLAQHQGKLLLLVNTASKCGLTGQYAGLQDLHERFADRGFSVIAFPCNDFLGQEPGTALQIQEFCSLNYQTTFPLMEKISVQGDDVAPLYNYLVNESPFPGKIRWNFDKFLIDGAGHVVGRFSPRTKPLDAQVIAAIESRLPTAAQSAAPSATSAASATAAAPATAEQ